MEKITDESFSLSFFFFFFFEKIFFKGGSNSATVPKLERREKLGTFPFTFRLKLKAVVDETVP